MRRELPGRFSVLSPHAPCRVCAHVPITVTITGHRWDRGDRRWNGLLGAYAESAPRGGLRVLRPGRHRRH
eukprot:7374443-Pyramimonas_sp.AAC.1